MSPLGREPIQCASRLWPFKSVTGGWGIITWWSSTNLCELAQIRVRLSSGGRVRLLTTYKDKSASQCFRENIILILYEKWFRTNWKGISIWLNCKYPQSVILFLLDAFCTRIGFCTRCDTTVTVPMLCWNSSKYLKHALCGFWCLVSG